MAISSPTITRRNAWPARTPSVLATMISVPEVDDLLGRTAAAGTATLTTMTATAFHSRRDYFTARRVGRDDPPRYLIAFEDVTERRGLERMLAAGRRTTSGELHPSRPKLSDADARTFAYLGERIRRADPTSRAVSTGEGPLPPQPTEQTRTAVSPPPRPRSPRLSGARWISPDRQSFSSTATGCSTPTRRCRPARLR